MKPSLHKFGEHSFIRTGSGEVLIKRFDDHPAYIAPKVISCQQRGPSKAAYEAVIRQLLLGNFCSFFFVVVILKLVHGDTF